MRRFIAVLLATCGLVGMLGIAPAQAADNVVDGDWCQSSCTEMSMGRIDVSVNFDDTNCDPHSASNCSGANGAKVDYLVAKYDQSASADLVNVGYDLISVDVWGDGTSAYVDHYNFWWVYQGASGGKQIWRAEADQITNARRIFFEIVSDSGLNEHQFGNLNPYGL